MGKAKSANTGGKKQIDGITGIISGRWEIDTLGDSFGNPPGGIFYRNGKKSEDRNLRFGNQIIYLDQDQNKTFSGGDQVLGQIRSTGDTTGKTGTFVQQSVGSNTYNFYADALGGASAGSVIFNANPW